MSDQIKVTAKCMTGPEGHGWYVLESEYPEEGYVYFSKHFPTSKELRQICEDYVLEPMTISKNRRDLLQQELNTTKYEGLTRFMVANRQTGSTTALVEAAVETDGYLIVGGQEIANVVLKSNPSLKKERVLTIQQVRAGSWSFDPRPVFIDTTAVWGIK